MLSHVASAPGDEQDGQADAKHLFSQLNIGTMPLMPSMPPEPPAALTMPPPEPADTGVQVRDSPSTKSSLETKFMVVSDSLHSFLKSQSATPLALESDAIAAHKVVTDWESSDDTCLLTDFEGENMGWGGVLETAQFLPTKCINPATLRIRDESKPDATTRTNLQGLLIDARGPVGSSIVKRIMESQKLIKLIWGADGDCASLCHQSNLRTVPVKVIDVQLAYSSPGKRLGMARALELVPSSFKERLPCKEANPDKYDPQAQNRRCNKLPCGLDEELYAMDDLHRIEAIISTVPVIRSFTNAMIMTQKLIDDLQSPKSGLEWLRQEMGYYNRKFGLLKSKKAVQFARACVHIELVFGTRLSASDKTFITKIKTQIAPELSRLGLVVKDLSFVDDS